jgi:hypothetical protein
MFRVRPGRRPSLLAADVLDGVIAKWIEKWETHHGGGSAFRLEDVYARKSGITPNREPALVERKELLRAGAALRRLGYTKRRERIGGLLSTWWKQR